jgi:hypothetical protein
MEDRDRRDERLARQARIASIVIASTIMLWMGAQWFGGKIGLEARYVFLFDLAALAGLAWALTVTWQAWRRGRDD